jgi:hypothetical protein
MEKIKKTLSGFHIGWPAVVLASVVILAVAMVLTFAPPAVQEKALEALGWVAYAISQIMGPIIRRKLTEGDSSEGEDQ